jgi:hypothetical protein
MIYAQCIHGEKLGKILNQWAIIEQQLSSTYMHCSTVFARRMYILYIVLMGSSIAVIILHHVYNPMNHTVFAALPMFVNTSFYKPMVVAQELATVYIFISLTFFECSVTVMAFHLSNHFVALNEAVNIRFENHRHGKMKSVDDSLEQDYIEPAKYQELAGMRNDMKARCTKMCLHDHWRIYEDIVNLTETFNSIFGPLICANYGLAFGIFICLAYVPLAHSSVVEGNLVMVSYLGIYYDDTTHQELYLSKIFSY